MKTYIVLLLTLNTLPLTLFSQTASITNIQVSPRTDGSGNVDIYYDLSGPTSTYFISLEASFNNGTTFTPIDPTYLSGNVGAISTGNNLHVIWNGRGSNNNTNSAQSRVKLNASTNWLCGQPFPDSRDGKTYNTVQIGTQCWMTQNLNIGTKINGSGIQTNNSTIEKYCYTDLEPNCSMYGGLYEWNEMMQYISTAGGKGICPTGWHIPTDDEWTTVTTFLRSESIAGGKMKSTGTIQAGTGLWNTPNTGATNESGFKAVPAGYHNLGGTFYGIGDYGYWWSSSEANLYGSKTWYRIMGYNASNVGRDSSIKNSGFSVRCLRDF